MLNGDIDLNLLVTFDKVYQKGSVSAAAEALGVTQPAVSRSLKRLRLLLGDELFVRTSTGMEPTSFAIALAEPLAYALGTINEIVSRPVVFEPRKSTREFTIALTDIGEIYILPRLMDVLKKEAPTVTITTVRPNPASLREEMEAGRIDLAIGQLDVLDHGFFKRQLLRQGYVCMYRTGHPIASKKKMTVSDFSNAEHVVVSAKGTGHAQVEELLDRKGLRKNIRLRVPHYVALGHILKTTDLIATVPYSLAMPTLSPFRLAFCVHPVELPKLAINQFWHGRFHRDPSNQWLRTLIAEHCSSEPSQ